MKPLKLKKSWLKSNKIAIFFIIASLLISIIPIGYVNADTQSDQLDRWNWRSPNTTGNNLNDVIYAEELFVAIGDNGTILTSLDGANWSEQYLTDNDNDLMGITYGDGKFLIVGPQTILVSDNGINWDENNSLKVKSDTKYFLNDVTFGNGKFVAVGYVEDIRSKYNAILTSNDGVTWRISPINNELIGIDYLNNTFIAVGKKYGIHSTILTSSDGMLWNKRLSNVTYDLFSTTHTVANEENLYVVVGTAGTLKSTDGIHWTQGLISQNIGMRDVIHGNDSFVAVGEQGIYKSSDGIAWEQQSFLPANAIAYGREAFVAVADNGVIQSSSYGDIWLKRSSNLDFRPLDIAYGNNSFVLLGEKLQSNINDIFISHDGSEWMKYNSTIANNLRSITYGDDKFIAVGLDGNIITSTNSINWTKRDSKTSNNLLGVGYSGNLYVAVGEAGTILTSPNGISWNSQDSKTNVQLLGVTYGNDRFIAVGYDGTVLSSKDGISWTKEAIGTTNHLFRIAYGNDTFVAIGKNGTILTSRDGVTWSELKTEIASQLLALTFDNNTFLAVGESGLVLASVDGIIWENKRIKVDKDLQGVAFGEDTFLVIGDKGTILQSVPLTADPISDIQPIWSTNAKITISNLTQTSFNISWLEARDNVGVTNYRVYIFDGQTVETAVETTDKSLFISGLTANRTYTARIIARDSVGNESNPLIKNITTPGRDIIPPIVRVNPSGGTHHGGKLVTLKGSEPVSIYYTTDRTTPTTSSKEYTAPIPITRQGLTVLKYMALDSSGNRSPIYTEIYYIIDYNHPSVEINIAGTLGNDDWYISDVQVSFTKVNNSSEIAVIEYSMDGVYWYIYRSSFAVRSEGINSIYYRLSDIEGNYGEIGEQIIKIDKTAPAAMQYNVDFLPPLDKDNKQEFKLNSTIPIKIMIKDNQGKLVEDANIKLFLAKITDGTIGEEVKASEPGNSNKGNKFNYDSEEKLYRFNLKTMNLSAGTWQLRMEVNNTFSEHYNLTLR